MTASQRDEGADEPSAGRLRSVRAVRPSFVGVVVPAHDEARRVARSVTAIRHALDHPSPAGTAVEIVVVADASSDSTAERAQRSLGRAGTVLEVRYRSAGAARRAGFDRLLAHSAGLDEEDVWFATTDADSLVRGDWMARQLAWWRTGADGVAGTVAPLTWFEQPAAARHRYEARMSAQGMGHGHPHLHGANLGMTRDTYRAAGGMPALDRGRTTPSGVRPEPPVAPCSMSATLPSSTRRAARSRRAVLAMNVDWDARRVGAAPGSPRDAPPRWRRVRVARRGAAAPKRVPRRGAPSPGGICSRATGTPGSRPR